MHTGVALPSGGRSLGTHPSSRGAGLRYAPLPQMPCLLPHTCSLEALWQDWVGGRGGTNADSRLLALLALEDYLPERCGCDSGPATQIRVRALELPRGLPVGLECPKLLCLPCPLHPGPCSPATPLVTPGWLADPQSPDPSLHRWPTGPGKRSFAQPQGPSRNQGCSDLTSLGPSGRGELEMETKCVFIYAFNLNPGTGPTW